MNKLNTAAEVLLQMDALDMKYRIVPIEYLSRIKADIDNSLDSIELNGFQKWIVNSGYVYDVLKPGFDVRSILIAALPAIPAVVKLSCEGKSVQELRNLTKETTRKKLLDIWSINGYKLENIYWLPQKRLAVRSGLAKYGQNNITYVEDYGSFYELFCCVTDMPYEGTYEWCENINLDECAGCSACAGSCPTGAISEDRFLIDNTRCLTAVNEQGTEPFPDWIPKSAHRMLVGCMCCQEVCPLNSAFFNKEREIIEYSEDETALLLEGLKYEELPKQLAEKIEKCGLGYCYVSIARNLKAMLENA